MSGLTEQLKVGVKSSPTVHVNDVIVPVVTATTQGKSFTEIIFYIIVYELIFR